MSIRKWQQRNGNEQLWESGEAGWEGGSKSAAKSDRSSTSSSGEGNVALVLVTTAESLFMKSSVLNWILLYFSHLFLEEMGTHTKGLSKAVRTMIRKLQLTFKNEHTKMGILVGYQSTPSWPAFPRGSLESIKVDFLCPETENFCYSPVV